GVDPAADACVDAGGGGDLAVREVCVAVGDLRDELAPGVAGSAGVVDGEGGVDRDEPAVHYVGSGSRQRQHLHHARGGARVVVPVQAPAGAVWVLRGGRGVREGDAGAVRRVPAVQAAVAGAGGCRGRRGDHARGGAAGGADAGAESRTAEELV